ncbi:hemolysin III family protein [Cereibacter azotoformans]|uniref:Hly-III family protein n=1 Tax=Cereibacter sphaeroides (strain ATCC 17025 / ATH 2.4.3) TaxID=349102 RepID=A4WRZ9_CERS5|nr:hemolysin III family protein [Cereibacter azotoformans]AXQ93400.1 Hly-III family protein [Cereibacter sphaeroides]UIJ31725.1 hemolysin III family protein [Cereibacter azotoformans]ULB09513.1 hemolysin III family protein [Cereibacter azotoformans]
MITRFAPRSEYSRAERLSDAAVHVSGIAAALCGVPVLIALTVLWRGDGMAVAGAAIYGVTLLLMIFCSAIYHMVPHPDWTALLRRLDHSAIYCKIAGTYSAFTLISGTGLSLLAGIWVAALCGTALKLHSPEKYRWAALALYLGMGWVGVLLGWPIFAALTMPVLVLMAVGGILYTVGVFFFLFERLPFHNTIWHLFVLTASILFYAAVFTHVAGTAAA